MSEAREQPGQRDLEPHSLLIDVDDALSALAHRRGAEGQAVSGPDLFVQRKQPGKLSLGAVEPGLDAAQGLVLAEAVRDRDDERLRHCGGLSFLVTAQVSQAGFNPAEA